MKSSAPKSKPAQTSGYRSWTNCQPTEAKNFRKAYQKARKIRPGFRTKSQKDICNLAVSLGLTEDMELSGEEEVENEEDPEDQPVDSGWIAENPVKVNPDTGVHSNNLTYIHPACHACGWWSI